MPPPPPPPPPRTCCCRLLDRLMLRQHMKKQESASRRPPTPTTTTMCVFLLDLSMSAETSSFSSSLSCAGTTCGVKVGPRVGAREGCGEKRVVGDAVVDAETSVTDEGGSDLVGSVAGALVVQSVIVSGSHCTPSCCAALNSSSLHTFPTTASTQHLGYLLTPLPSQAKRQFC